MADYIFGIYPAIVSSDVAPTYASTGTINTNDGVADGTTLATVNPTNSPSPATVSFAIDAGSNSTDFEVAASGASCLIKRKTGADFTSLIGTPVDILINWTHSAGSGSFTRTVNVTAAGAATLLTSVTLENTSASTSPTNTFFSFYQEFKRGDIPAGNIPVLTNSDDSEVAHQWDQMAYWGDGSLLGAACSARTTALNAAATRTFRIYSQAGTLDNTETRSTSDINATAGHDIKLDLASFAGRNSTTHNGSGSWKISLNTGLGESEVSKRRSGPVCDSWRVDTPARDNTGGAAHPHIRGTFFVRAWTNADGSAGPVQHLCYPYQGDLAAGTDPQDTYDYDATYANGASTLGTYTDVMHVYSSGWFSVQDDGQWWWTSDQATLAKMHVAKDTTYCLSTKLYPPMDMSVSADLAVTPATYSVRGNGEWALPINGTGGKPQLGFSTQWDIHHFKTQDPDWAQQSLVHTLLAAVLPCYWMDEDTHHPPTVLNADYFGTGTKKPTSWFYGTANFSADAVYPLGATDRGFWSFEGTGPDCSHEPNLGYMAYLHFGDEHLLELMYRHVMGMYFSFPESARNLTYDRTYYGVHVVASGNPRLMGWAAMILACASRVAPEADTEGEYLRDLMAENMAATAAIIASASADFLDVGWWMFAPSDVNKERSFQTQYIMLGSLYCKTLWGDDLPDASAWADHVSKWLIGCCSQSDMTAGMPMQAYNFMINVQPITSPAADIILPTFADAMFVLTDENFNIAAGTNTMAITNTWGLGWVPTNGDMIRPTVHADYSDNGQTLPTGINDMELLYVVNASGQNFQLSRTPGGAPITFSGGSPSTQQWFSRLQANPGTNNVLFDDPTRFPYEVWAVLGWAQALGITGAATARANAEARLNNPVTDFAGVKHNWCITTAWPT